MTGWFDTHAHLDDPRFDADREELLAALPREGVALCLTVGSTVESSARAVALAGQYPYLYAAVGLHPHEAGDWNAGVQEALVALARQPRVVAWGEIGLDYHYDHAPRSAQQAALVQQMALAREAGLPVILHVREAWEDFLPLLRGRSVAGVVHCWSGGLAEARACLDAGLYISFAGQVTFKKAADIHAVARYVPAERLLVETDSPYLAPEPVRGRRNDPRNVRHILSALAVLRGEDPEDLMRRTLLNGCRLFSIHHSGQ